jgi:enoyl-[acyl-carrier-protein] reductase (NADH)
MIMKGILKMEVRNNVQSPNFGMASWFTRKGAKVFVESASDSMNKKVAEVMDKVAGTKTYNVEFTTNEAGDRLVPRIVSPYADKYLPPYRAKMPHDEFLTVEATWDGTNLGGDLVPGNIHFPINLKYENAKAAEEAYARVNKDTFDAAAEIATKLEESFVTRAAAAANDAAKKAANSEKAQALVNKAGFDDSYTYKFDEISKEV